jgi:hypothetical protein
VSHNETFITEMEKEKADALEMATQTDEKREEKAAG